MHPSSLPPHDAPKVGRARHALSVIVVGLIGLVCLLHGVAFGSMMAPLAQGAQVDSAGRPVAPDFRAFYSAAHFIHEGAPNEAYNYEAQGELQRRLFGPETNLLPWRYAPPTLLLVSPLGGLSYAHACLLWTLLGITCLLLATSAVTRRLDLLIWVVLSPSLAFTAFTGQIGIFVTALLLVGLGMLRRHPRVAGMCLGALILKPHMAVLLPVLLWALRDRQLLRWTVGTGAALVALSLLFFGLDPWLLFFAELGRYGHAMLGQQQPQWDRIPSVYVFVRELGASGMVAWTVHGVVACGAVLVLARALRQGDLAQSRHALLFCAATLLTLPYVADYDLLILMVPAILYLSERPEWPRPSHAIALFALVSVGTWLRLTTEEVGLQYGPLLWLLLLAGAAAPVALSMRRQSA